MPHWHEYTGHHPPQDKLVISGSPADREFVAFSLREGRVQARMAVNTWDRMGELSALIRSRDRISGAALGRFAA
ncbi:hypothetical protein GCM10023176_23920 [Micromonospora coerulea]|uniref:Reductase C-terminal domain-containing protein n=1 Tax=Micromonospora coerulea TaxID=47856 RepID=A0ABP8SHP2_9ACTN